MFVNISDGFTRSDVFKPLLSPRVGFELFFILFNFFSRLCLLSQQFFGENELLKNYKLLKLTASSKTVRVVSLRTSLHVFFFSLILILKKRLLNIVL